MVMPDTFQTAKRTYNRRVTKPLGQGGACVVWEVESEGEVYALKILKEPRETSKKNRFANELELLERLKHENVIAIRDHGVKDGSPFYVMPKYDGTIRLLFDEIHISHEEDGSKNFAPALQALDQILSAVKYIHDHDAIHRDLKPENILYSKAGFNVVISDFGIAKPPPDNPVYINNKTIHKKARVANFRYSAPEQKIEGANVDFTVDLYAIGFILYELFMGDIPDGQNYQKISERYPEFGHLDVVIEKAIHKQPDKRFRSAAEFKSELRRSPFDQNGRVMYSLIMDKIGPVLLDYCIRFKRVHRSIGLLANKTTGIDEETRAEISSLTATDILEWYYKNSKFLDSSRYLFLKACLEFSDSMEVGRYQLLDIEKIRDYSNELEIIWTNWVDTEYIYAGN